MAWIVLIVFVLGFFAVSSWLLPMTLAEQIEEQERQKWNI